MPGQRDLLTKKIYTIIYRLPFLSTLDCLVWFRSENGIPLTHVCWPQITNETENLLLIIAYDMCEWECCNNICWGSEEETDRQDLNTEYKNINIYRVYRQTYTTHTHTYVYGKYVG